MVIFDSFPPLPPLATQKSLVKYDSTVERESHDDKVLIRNDDRQLEELRPITIRTGVIENADGSAYFSIGNTKVLCGIYGPNLCKQNPTEDGLLISVEYTIGRFCRDHTMTKNKLNTDNNEVKDTERIKSTLLEKVISSVICHEKYKRSSIDCHFYIIDDDGSAFSAAISAACISLCNANIEIIGLFSATNIIAVHSHLLTNESEENMSDGEYYMILDPTYNEIYTLGSGEYSVLEIGICNIKNQVIYLSANGNFFNDPKRIEEGLSLAEASCSTITNEIKNHLTLEFNAKNA